jgi:hypothetical protein
VLVAAQRMNSITRLARRAKPSKVGKSPWDAGRVVVARSVSLAVVHSDKDRPAISAWVSRQGSVVMQAARDFTVATVQKAADIAMQSGSRLYTDSASSYRALKGYLDEFVNHT